MSNNPLVRDALSSLRAAGLPEGDLIRESLDERNFGNAEAVLRINGLILRFVRDRGEDFLSVASPLCPEKFHAFDDIEIAMGWTSIDQALAKRKAEGLASVVNRLAQKSSELVHALSGAREPFTRERIERSAAERGDAFVAKLRR